MSSDQNNFGTGGPGWYDVRRGASGYAPIIGTFGALSIPTIFLLFNTEVVREASQAHIIFAVGCLILSFLGTVFGSIGLAAIGAERVPTANLSASLMALSVSITVGFAGLFAGIDTVGVLFVPSAAWLFGLLLAMTGAVGAFLTSAAIADSVATGPKAESNALVRPRWITTRSAGMFHTMLSAGVACIPIAFAAIARLLGVQVDLSLEGTSVLIAVSAGFVFASLIYSTLRAAHREDGRQSALRPVEAYIMTFLSGTYPAMLLLMVP